MELRLADTAGDAPSWLTKDDVRIASLLITEGGRAMDWDGNLVGIVDPETGDVTAPDGRVVGRMDAKSVLAWWGGSAVRPWA